MCCYSKDPELINDSVNGDIHKLWADYLGVGRFDAKQNFVFALPYGSYYVNIFKSLSPSYPKLTERRVKQAEDEYWKKYKVLKRWQEELISSYYRNGYIEMLTGFRCVGWLSRNQIVNTPIQGTAFHLLLWACIEINRIRKEEEWKTKLIGQIHDEMNLDVNPREEDRVKEDIKWVMEEGTRNQFPWVIVPLLSEYGSCGVDEPWGAAKK